MFHRIGELDPKLGPIAPKDAVSTADFRRIIQHIAKHHTPISLGNFVDRTQHRKVPDRAVVVTFDDGFTDNLTVALPVLEEFQVPATVFVATGFIDRSTQPYHYILASLLGNTGELAFSWNGNGYHWSLGSDDQRSDCFSCVYRMLKPLPIEPRNSLLKEIIGSREDSDTFQDQYLTWQQVAALATSKQITIGAHTHNHVLLRGQPSDIVINEAKQSRKLLESHLDEPIQHFSYPHGGHDRSVRKAIRTLGFQSAVAVDRRDWWENNRFQMQRLCVSSQLASNPNWLPS